MRNRQIFYEMDSQRNTQMTKLTPQTSFQARMHFSYPILSFRGVVGSKALGSDTKKQNDGVFPFFLLGFIFGIFS